MRLLIALLLASSVFAQTANVIQLESTDADRAQKAWDTLQKAQVDWDKTRGELEIRYILVKQGDPDAGTLSTTTGIILGSGSIGFTSCGVVLSQADCPKETPEEKAKREKEVREWDDAHYRFYRKGFENGFEFSKDFKFLVPRPPIVRPSTLGLPNCSNGICW